MTYLRPRLQEIDVRATLAGCCTGPVQYPVNGGKFVVNGDCIVPV